MQQELQRIFDEDVDPFVRNALDQMKVLSNPFVEEALESHKFLAASLELEAAPQHIQGNEDLESVPEETDEMQRSQPAATEA